MVGLVKLNVESETIDSMGMKGSFLEWPQWRQATLQKATFDSSES
jgi:hypothetical protein